MKDSIQNISSIKKLWNEVDHGFGINITNEHLNIIEQVGNLFAAGAYYYYIYNIDSQKMEYVSKGVEDMYGIPAKSFTMKYLLGLYPKEDLDKLLKKKEVITDFLFNKIPSTHVVDYKVVYLNRIISKDSIEKTILHQIKPLNVNDNGRVLKTLGVHTDVTYLNSPVDHKISFISEKYPSYYSVPTIKDVIGKNESLIFSEREIDVIRLVSNGLTFIEIGKELLISPETVKTHKKNILKKINAKNMAQLVTFCLRERII